MRRLTFVLALILLTNILVAQVFIYGGFSYALEKSQLKYDHGVYLRIGFGHNFGESVFGMKYHIGGIFTSNKKEFGSRINGMILGAEIEWMFLKFRKVNLKMSTGPMYFSGTYRVRNGEEPIQAPSSRYYGHSGGGSIHFVVNDEFDVELEGNLFIILSDRNDGVKNKDFLLMGVSGIILKKYF